MQNVLSLCKYTQPSEPSPLASGRPKAVTVVGQSCRGLDGVLLKHAEILTFGMWCYLERESLKMLKLGIPSDSVVENMSAMQETRVRFLGQEDPLEEDTATHSSILAWIFPWHVLSIGLQRVRPEWSNLECIHTCSVFLYILDFTFPLHHIPFP